MAVSEALMRQVRTLEVQGPTEDRLTWILTGTVEVQDTECSCAGEGATFEAALCAMFFAAKARFIPDMMREVKDARALTRQCRTILKSRLLDPTFSSQANRIHDTSSAIGLLDSVVSKLTGVLGDDDAS